jgi:hypothetical protein
MMAAIERTKTPNVQRSESASLERSHAVLRVIREAMQSHGLESELSYHVGLVDVARGKNGADVFRVWFRYHPQLRRALSKDYGAWNGSGENLGAIMVPRRGRTGDREPTQVSQELQALLREYFPSLVWTVRRVTRVERATAPLRYMPTHVIELLDKPEKVSAGALRAMLGLPARAQIQVLAPNADDFSEIHFRPLDAQAREAGLPEHFATPYASVLLRIVDARQTWYAVANIALETYVRVNAEDLPSTIRAYRDSFELTRRPIAKRSEKGGHHSSPVEHTRQGHWRRLPNKPPIWIEATRVGAKKRASTPHFH